MIYLAFKALLSGVIIMIISELAKRSPPLGALVASLPLVSVLGMIWLWRETADVERLATHAQATFWYVLPSLPMFLVLPALLRGGMSFWLAMGLCVLLTAGLYLAMTALLGRFGYRL
jgi:hypothetical protein